MVVFEESTLILGGGASFVAVERGVHPALVSSQEVGEHVGPHPDVVFRFLKILDGAYGGKGLGNALLVGGPFDLHQSVAASALGVGPHGGFFDDDSRHKKGIYTEFSGGFHHYLGVFFGGLPGELGVFFPEKPGDDLVRRRCALGISQGTHGEKVPVVVEEGTRLSGFGEEQERG